MQIVIVGGSDAAISAGLRTRKLEPSALVQRLIAGRYANFSICGIRSRGQPRRGSVRELARHARRIVALLRAGSGPRQAKIHQPAADVTEDDLRAAIEGSPPHEHEGVDAFRQNARRRGFPGRGVLTCHSVALRTRAR